MALVGFLAQIFPTTFLTPEWYPGIHPFTVDLKPGKDNSLHGTFSLGIPRNGRAPQSLVALFDTGTSHLWVVSKDHRIRSGSFTPYNGENSGTYSSQRTSISENYGAGTIKGYLSQDVVKIGRGDKSIVLEDQMFAEATIFSPKLKGILFDTYDAVFGLDLITPDTLGDSPETPLIAMSRKYGKAPVFGFYVNRSFKSSSKLVFGKADHNFFVGRFTTHLVVKRNGLYRGWNVQIDKLEIQFIGSSAKIVPVGNDKFGRLYFRSISLITGPKDIIDDLNEQIFGRFLPSDITSNTVPKDLGFYSFACKSMEHMYMELPDVSVYINGKKYKFIPQDYLREFNGVCESMFIGADVPYFILGNEFMTKYYIRFDYEKKAVHIARARQTEDLPDNKYITDQKVKLRRRLAER